MSITAASAVFNSQGPTASGQVAIQSPNAGTFANALVGAATFTGDAASSTAVLNYIDGTAALSFVPSAIFANRVGGAATATIGVVSVTDNADGGKTATVQFTGTVNAATIKVGFILLK